MITSQRSIIFKICRRKYKFFRHRTSQADMTRIQNKLCKTHLGVAAVLLITYIYGERGELGYSVNGANNKGFCMNIAEVFQNETCQNHTNISRDPFKAKHIKTLSKQEVNRIHLSSLTSLKGCLLTSAKHIKLIKTRTVWSVIVYSKVLRKFIVLQHKGLVLLKPVALFNTMVLCYLGP